MTYTIPANDVETCIDNLCDAGYIATIEKPNDSAAYSRWIDDELAKFGIKWNPYGEDTLPEHMDMLRYEDPADLFRFRLTWG